MKYYVASGVQNAERVNIAADVLNARGFLRTYDWTKHGSVSAAPDETKHTVAAAEASAVQEAELIVLLLPGGFGTHAELGLAIASKANKRILLWSETEEPFVGKRDFCVFYHHPSVERFICPFNQLLQFLATL
ncbi:MAG: group-specific protein [Clostridia bacterium]